MKAIAIGVIFLGYTGGLWAYCLIRGYNVPLKALFSPNGLAPPKGTNPLAGGIVGPGVAQQIQNQTRNQFGPGTQPTPTGQITQAQQFTGQ